MQMTWKTYSIKAICNCIGRVLNPKTESNVKSLTYNIPDSMYNALQEGKISFRETSQILDNSRLCNLVETILSMSYVWHSHCNTDAASNET
jgi:hypothetical protein